MLPQTPLDRLLAAGTLLVSAALVGTLAANRDALRAGRYVAATTQAVEPAAAVDPAARRTPVPTASHARAAGRPSAPPPALTITAARGASWLEVRTASSGGEQLHYGLLERGRTLTFARLPVWVRVGALANLDLRLASERVEPPPGADGGVAELVASPAGVVAPGS